MRGGKRPNVPAGVLISLGTKSKKPLLSSSLTGHGNPAKKAKGDYVEVKASELVSQTESAIKSGNMNLAESLVLSALNQLRAAGGGPTFSTSMTVGFRSVPGPSSGSRLIPGFALGLLILAQSHPALFARGAIFDQLINLISLSPRELGISLPPAAVATICARVRGLHVLVANLIYFAFASNSKWPSRLVKVYLEDSLMDRVWVDQDECRAFVLNVETAFPKPFGDPRGLFTVLCSSGSAVSTTQSSGSGASSGSSIGSSGTSSAVHAILGLVPGQANVLPDVTDGVMRDDIAEAVAVSLKSPSPSIAKIIHGGDPNQQVSPRFEGSRQAVEVIIVNTLREALGRRGPSVSSTSSAVSGASVGGVQSTTGPGSGPTQGVGPSVGSVEASQLRGLIRTVAMACGLPEVRGLVATRLEPWITNPKIQLYTVGLLAILATNCRLGGLSPHDLDVMISVIFRIRYKLLKPTIQAAFLECLSHMARANPMNLYCLVHLCTIPELKPPLTGDQSDGKIATGQFVAQTVLKIAETVRSMSEASAQDRDGKTAQQQQTQLSMSAVAAGASTAVATRGSASVYTILPFLYQRFGPQWIRIMGSLIHERLLLTVTTSKFGRLSTSSALTSNQVIEEVLSSMTTVYTFLRELARNSRPNLTDSGPLGANQSTSTATLPGTNQSLIVQQTYLPCAELAGALLQDRNYRVNTTASAAASAIVSALSSNEYSASTDQHAIVSMLQMQFYLNGLISLICTLQMLSASRPHLIGGPASKRTASHLDAMKIHQTTLRQIRLAVIRWAKNILPCLVNAVVQSSGTSNTTSHGNHLLACLETLELNLLIRRAFMLDSTTPLQKSDGVDYELSSFYPVKGVWTNDQEHSLLIRMVTDTVLPEKLARQLLILGLEPNRHLFNAMDSLDMVCELIWRAALLAHDSGLEPLNVTEPQQLIDLLFASCTYVGEQQLPPDAAELAYASAYWRVSITAVILAAHCLQTCGSHLWMHYPTVRRLMEMVMTDDFSVSSAGSTSELDSSIAEAEQLNSQLEVQLILRLESFLLNPHPERSDAPAIVVTPETSKLLGRLVRNNPRGPCRLPPVEQLNNLRTVAHKLRLGRRLWRCRDPDFLLELLHNQAGHATVQSWLVRLVESSGTDFELLPIQCLCEYLLRVTVSRMRQSHKHVFPLTTTQSLSPTSLSSDNAFGFLAVNTSAATTAVATTSGRDSKTETGTCKSELRSHLIAKLRESLRTFGNNTTADALAHSFFARLNDKHNWVRQAVRQCLFLLTEFNPNVSNDSQDSVFDWLNTLYTLLQLPVLRVEGVTDPSQHLLSALLDSLLVETDLNILLGELIFLSRVTRSPNFVSWRPLLTSLTQFIHCRPNILFSLLYRHTEPMSSGTARTDSTTVDLSYIALEALCEMHVRYVEYNCTSAGAIPVDERKSVFVTWSADRECPLELDLIQAQLLLLSHTHDDLPHRIPQAVMEILDTSPCTDYPSPSDCSWWLRLRDTWFLPTESGQYRLPQLTPFAAQLSNFPVSGLSCPSELRFEQSAEQHLPPRLCISSALRCGLIRSNHLPLVSGALWNIKFEELVTVIENLPIYLLRVDTSQQLLLCWDALRKQISTDLQRQLDVKITQLREKCHPQSFIDQSMEEDALPSESIGRPEHVDEVSLGEELKAEPDTMLWSNLITRLQPLTDRERVQTLCKITRELVSDEQKCRVWLEQLIAELASAARDLSENCSLTNLSKLGRSSLRSTSHNLSRSSFLVTIGSDPMLCRSLRPLVSVCLQKIPEMWDVISTYFQAVATQCSEVLSIRTNMFPRLMQQPLEDEKMTTNADNIHLPLVDSVDQFGLIELARHFPTLQSDIIPSDSGTVHLISRVIQSAIFQHAKTDDTSLAVSVELDGAYLLRCVLQQANPTVLCHLIRSLLCERNVETINSTHLLDFFVAALTLPRLAYPVPRSEPRDRPDPSAALSELHHLSLLEAINLIQHVLLEAKQVAAVSPSSVAQAIDAALLQRIVCLNMAVTQYPTSCVRCLEYFSGCLSVDDQQESTDADLVSILRHSLSIISQTDTLWNLTALRLLLLLYQRWPGTLGLIRSSLAKNLIVQPWSVRDAVRNNPRLKAAAAECDRPLGSVDLSSQPEIDRLGPLLLVTLTSNNVTLAESALLACKSLFVHHSRAVFNLLPVLAALSEGRLELGWTQFSTRRYHLLFSDLLHLLELLLAPKFDIEIESDDEYNSEQALITSSSSSLFCDEVFRYRSAIERLLGNMIRMLVKYRLQVKKLGGFSSRLCRLFDAYAVHELGRQSLMTLFQTIPKDMKFLVGEFDEFAPLLNITCVKTESNDTGGGGSPVFPILNPAAHGARTTKRWNVAIHPFRQRLHWTNSIQSTIDLLQDLDEASKRKVDILVHFKSDLVRLVSHPNGTVCSLSLRLLLRFMIQFPHWALSLIETGLLPFLSPKLSDQSSLRIAILEALPTFCLLAPTLAPRLLHMCAESVLFGGPHETNYETVSACEEAVRRLTLDGLDAACVEHAASALISRTNLTSGGGQSV